VITDTLNKKSHPAITSDRWHVVHARWSGDRGGEPRFVRSIVSEHDDNASATKEARGILAKLAPEMANRPRARRDQVFVRKPDYKSLKTAKRVQKRRK
jgi:hypothetical protein